MGEGTHEPLVFRLAQILIKLNQGEKLDPAELASEFGVNLRTIQRDLNERFAYLPLVRSNGRYHLDPAFLGKLGLRDIERFAGLAGIRGLFPSLSDDFLRDIFDNRTQSALLIKGHHYEDISDLQDAFRLLERAIIHNRKVDFAYRRNRDSKAYTEIEPYRLINSHGIWYLAARDGEKLKTFVFSQMEHLQVHKHTFAPDPHINKRLEEEDGIWFTDDNREVLLHIATDIAGHFKRRKLIANQFIEKELEDGSLLLSVRIGHANQILPIVRYWIPHIRIISPEELRNTLEQQLRTYLSR